jgi:hypothetical protein
VHAQDAPIDEFLDRGVTGPGASRGTVKREPVSVHQGASASVDAVIAARRLDGELDPGLALSCPPPARVEDARDRVIAEARDMITSIMSWEEFGLRV